MATPATTAPSGSTQVMRKAAWLCVVLGMLLGLAELASPNADAQAVATISTTDYELTDPNEPILPAI